MQEEKTQAEESLEDFKKRIRKLSLDELYDELDAAEKKMLELKNGKPEPMEDAP